jgi:RNase P/RNase MRP subunit p30
VISLPLTLPRLPFHLKHTLIRTAKKNGAVFEMNYSGAFGSDPDAFEIASAATKRNWWAAAREVIRVTKGKGLIVSGGVTSEADLRAPRDIINLYANPISVLTLTLTSAQNYHVGLGSRPGSWHNEQRTSSTCSPCA